MSKLKNRIEALQTQTNSSAVLKACNEAAYIMNPQEDAKIEETVLNNLLENLSKIDDESAKQFVAMHTFEQRVSALDNLGVKQVFESLASSDIAKHPAFAYAFEKLKGISNNPEWLIIENVIAGLTPFNWDPTVNEGLKTLTESADKYREDIAIYKIVENLKKSASSYLYPGLSAVLENYLATRSSSDRVKLMEKTGKFLFDSHVKALHGFLAESERNFHIAVSDNSCTVNRIYSPVYLAEAAEFFVVEGKTYKRSGNTVAIANEDEIKSFPKNFMQIAEILSWENLTVSEGLIKIYSGDKIVQIAENNGKATVTINGHAANTADIHKVYLNSGMFRMNESGVINAIVALVENWNSIFELDFAKTVTSKVDTHKSMTVFFLGENIYINKTHKLLGENVFYSDCNVTQTRNLVMEFMKFDISSSFSQLLNEEEKQITEVKALKAEYIQAIEMLNSRKQILEGTSTEIRNTPEVKELIQAIDEEITTLKDEYSKIATTEYTATHVTEGIGLNVGDEAMLRKKK